MNKFINALQVFLLLPILLFTIFVAFDLSVGFVKKIYLTETITMGEGNNFDMVINYSEFPYQAEIFLGLGLLVFIINLRRSLRRWMGMRLVKRQGKFKWNAPVSSSRKKRVFTYLTLEGLVFGCAGIALYVLTPLAWMPAFAYLFVAIDNIVFGIVGNSIQGYRIGLSSKALVVADRDVIILYFTGLRKVSVHQQSIYFDYIKGLQLSFPSDCVEEENKGEFFKLLEDQMDPERVYFSKKL